MGLTDGDRGPRRPGFPTPHPNMVGGRLRWRRLRPGGMPFPRGMLLLRPPRPGGGGRRHRREPCASFGERGFGRGDIRRLRPASHSGRGASPRRRDEPGFRGEGEFRTSPVRDAPGEEEERGSRRGRRRRDDGRRAFLRRPRREKRPPRRGVRRAARVSEPPRCARIGEGVFEV